MKYYSPTFELAIRLGPQTSVMDKIGGLPWGLSADEWPHCAECGGTMSHIGQFAHDDERLDLGGVGRVLFVFQCEHGPGTCATWSPTSGANRVWIAEPAAPGGLTAAPGDTLVYPEIRATAWSELDDGIRRNEIHSYYDDEVWLSLGSEGWEKPTWGTKAGGVPMWVGSLVPPDIPSNTEYLLQIDSGNDTSGEPASPDETGWGRQRRVNNVATFDYPAGSDASKARVWLVEHEEKWAVLGPNFGQGMAYVFLDRRESPPCAYMLWQC